MKLLERLAQAEETEPRQRPQFLTSGPSQRDREPVADSFQQLKLAVHNRLFETLDVTRLESLDSAQAQTKVTEAIAQILQEEGALLTEEDRKRLSDEIRNELLGLGPLEPLLWDDSITDILVNGSHQVYIERDGKLHPTKITFQDDQHLLMVIDRIVSQVGRHIDESSPMVDARLRDGSRVNAIIPPLAVHGPALSIRRFGHRRFHINDLIERGSMSSDMAEFIAALVRARLNVMICGGTGSGKTVLLNCMSAFIPEDERIITIEDSVELMLQQPHVVTLETRPPNTEGQGEVTQRDLVRNSLRMRPDRIIVGEARGAEVFDMLQAMSTGHDGSLTTIHANNPRDSLGRLEMLMMLCGTPIPERAMRQHITAAINIIIHVSRMSDGSRKILKISEITGMEGDVVMMEDLWEFVRTGISASGRILGEFRCTGIRSAYANRLEAAGYKFSHQAAAPAGERA